MKIIIRAYFFSYVYKAIAQTNSVILYITAFKGRADNAVGILYGFFISADKTCVRIIICILPDVDSNSVKV